MEDKMKAKKILAFLISAGITLQSAPIFAMAEEEVIFDGQILELTPESTADVVIPAEKIIFAEEIPPETEAADANTDLTETVPATAEEAPVLYAVSGDFEYSVNEDGRTATITGFVGTVTGDLVIPEKIDGYTVTSIGDYAFYNCYGFTGSLTIGDSVTSIGNYAFNNCSGFTGSLTIPDSVTSIGNSAFYYCSGFTGSLTIPDSVTSIGNSAFYYCSGFTGSLTIPDSVT
ncbi:MAG: leucine-rich repeat domain-containing protein, partial [Clostridia bacterium]|nr:leucine-rich repeat domain-containing protein [Clostridia bacterium]